jgi:hypothetical protein
MEHQWLVVWHEGEGSFHCVDTRGRSELDLPTDHGLHEREGQLGGIAGQHLYRLGSPRLHGRHRLGKGTD